VVLRQLAESSGHGADPFNRQFLESRRDLSEALSGNDNVVCAE
jgi:hypothetical protein